MASAKEFNVAIVGGGIAGLTLAVALSPIDNRGVEFAIYEQASQFGEIGAGVSFSPNAVQAMRYCHEVVHDAFERVCTRNLWPSKHNVWFDYFDGSQEPVNQQKPIFSITNSLGQNGVHRARFLEELVRLLPDHCSHFGKKLEHITQSDTGDCVLHFEDGYTAKADAVIGCDGIKSRTRQIMYGEGHPCVHPSYTFKYAYRWMVPMAQAAASIGDEKAYNACMHLGQDGHVLTFPVDHGQSLNIVAFHTTQTPWMSSSKLVARGRREDALRDFKDFGDNVQKLLNMIKQELDVWAIFDLAQNPPPTYAQGRICILGDAAHATSPHHGAGAGMCVEDAAVMAELLGDIRVHCGTDVEAAFEAYNAARFDRGCFLVQSSRFIGDAYELRAAGINNDFERIRKEIEERNAWIADIDLDAICKQAKADMYRRLDAAEVL